MTSVWDAIRGFPRERPLVSLLLAIVAVELVGASGAVFTQTGLESWYATLERPAVAPPNWVFGPVWSGLFALMGVAVWRVWRRAGDAPARVRVAIATFAVHFAFNLGWSAAFFGLGSIRLGLGVIAVLWVLILATMWAFDRVDRPAALLLVPYLAWVTFAAYLNYRFWVLN